MHTKTTGFTRNLLFQCFIIFLGTSLLYGYNFSAVNLPSRFIKEFYNSTYTDRGTPLTSHMLTFLFSFTVTVWLVGCFIGTLLAGCISKRTGRKKLVLFCQIPNILGSVLQTICVSIKSPESLMIGRFILGLGSGIGSQIAPVYVSELSPQEIRGTLLSGNLLIACIGMVLAGSFGLDKIFGTENLWMYILLMPVIPSLICSMVLSVLAESPRFLLLDKHNENKAEKVIQLLRQKEDVVEELNELKQEAEALKREQVEKYTFLQMAQCKEYRLPLVLAFLVSLSMQVTGMAGVLFYTPGIFQAIGLNEVEIQFSVLGMFVSLLLGTAISVYLIDKAGRRPLLLVPMVIITVLLPILTVCTHFQSATSWLSYIGVVCAIIFCLVLPIGPGNLAWVIPPELFKQGPRDVASSFSVATIWMSTLVFAATFEFMAEAMGSFVFLLFMALTLCFTVVFYWKVPETKNKTFQEIAKLLSGRKTVERQMNETKITDDSRADE